MNTVRQSGISLTAAGMSTSYQLPARQSNQLAVMPLSALPLPIRRAGLPEVFSVYASLPYHLPCSWPLQAGSMQVSHP